jgi:hypothetical protein
VRISGFEWDEGIVVHVTLGHGIEPQEAEAVFAVAPVYRRTKRGHYAAFTMEGKGLARVMTGWDMESAEQRYYQQQRRR